MVKLQYKVEFPGTNKDWTEDLELVKTYCAVLEKDCPALYAKAQIAVKNNDIVTHYDLHWWLNKEKDLVPVKLTKKALNEFITWNSSRYNNYLGYGTKKQNVALAYNSLLKGYYTWINDYGSKAVTEKKDLTIFEIQCAGSVGESGTGRYWKVRGGGDDYTVDCINKTIIAKYSKRIIKFL